MKSLMLSLLTLCACAPLYGSKPKEGIDYIAIDMTEYPVETELSVEHNGGTQHPQTDAYTVDHMGFVSNKDIMLHTCKSMLTSKPFVIGLTCIAIYFGL